MFGLKLIFMETYFSSELELFDENSLEVHKLHSQRIQEGNFHEFRDKTVAVSFSHFPFFTKFSERAFQDSICRLLRQSRTMQEEKALREGYWSNSKVSWCWFLMCSILSR